ncbi:MAG TPA: cyclic nucleotide-binding domain-containing protein [Solirubrobacteraceae bacterium]|nr:cyclic nucleotide-binding domain-containing protein [Solirubrobacteraceae bacterium]
MGTTEQELPGEVLDYLSAQNTLTLATASPSGTPHAATFLYVNEGPSLYFWSKASTESSRHIEQNPLVAFTIDEYTDDLTQTRGVQGIGECSPLLSGEQIARVADLFGQKFPSLSPGATMSISFYRITPTEVQFIDNRRSRSLSSPGVFGADFHRERSYSVLGGLPTQTAKTISAALQVVDADPDTVVARQGGPADKFFIVVEGELEVTREEMGSTETVATLGPGDLFGEMAILFDKPRGTSARATKPTKLLVLDSTTFRSVVAQSLGTTPDFDQIIRDRIGAAPSTA